MRKIMNSLASVVLLAAPAVLRAQSDDVLKCYVSFGQNVAHNHAATLTGTPYGGPGSFHAEFGVEFLHPQSTLLVRPNAGYTRILSKEPRVWEVDGYYGPEFVQEVIYDLLGVYTGFDLVWTVSKRLPITATAGPSFHWWSVERAGVPLSQRAQGTREVKIGVRLGVDYAINQTFRVGLAYTMTEWRSRASLGYREGFNPSTPCYFTVKGSYSF